MACVFGTVTPSCHAYSGFESVVEDGMVITEGKLGRDCGASSKEPAGRSEDGLRMAAAIPEGV